MIIDFKWPSVLPGNHIFPRPIKCLSSRQLLHTTFSLWERPHLLGPVHSTDVLVSDCTEEMDTIRRELP